MNIKLTKKQMAIAFTLVVVIILYFILVPKQQSIYENIRL